MTVYRVVCKEEVSTGFFVEASDRATLQDWIDGELKGASGDTTAADVVSNMTASQVVHERDFEIHDEFPENAPPADFTVTKAR